MRSMVVLSVIGAVCCSVAASVSAAPTTRPTTGPSQSAAAPSVGKDNRLVTCEKLGFRFQVSRAWKAIAEKPEAGQFEYEMTSRLENRPPRLNITGGQACHGDVTLEAEVKALRDAYLNAGGLKLVKEEPLQLAGEPAHSMLFQQEVKVMASPGWPKDKPLPKAPTQRMQVVVALHQAKVYIVQMDCDAQSYDARARVLNRVLESFEWTTPSGGDQEQKKT